jgi:hypothetical protein
MQSIQLATFDLDALRTRLRKMSDEDLRKFGQAAQYMVSPTANMGKPALPTFVLQLEEARAEWRRRHVETDVDRTQWQRILEFNLLCLLGCRHCLSDYHFTTGLHGASASAGMMLTDTSFRAPSSSSTFSALPAYIFKKSGCRMSSCNSSNANYT